MCSRKSKIIKRKPFGFVIYLNIIFKNDGCNEEVNDFIFAESFSVSLFLFLLQTATLLECKPILLPFCQTLFFFFLRHNKGIHV